MGTFRNLIEHSNILIEGEEKVSRQGIRFMLNFLREHYPDIVRTRLDELLILEYVGEAWVTEKGKITKRLQKYFKDKFNLKIPNEIMGVLGDALTNFVVTNEIYVEVSREIDWDPGDFGDSQSCFWGSRSGARELIAQSGGGALKFYINDEKSGRCLFLPYNNDIVFFNVYGNSGNFSKGSLEFLQIILEQIFRKIYKDKEFFIKRVCLENYGYSDKLLYFNQNEGIIVSENLCNNVVIDFRIDYECYYCGDVFYEGEWDYTIGNFVCNYCKNGEECSFCGNLIRENDLSYLTADRELICHGCYETSFAYCDECNEIFHIDSLNPIGNLLVCHECVKDNYITCDCCYNYTKDYYSMNLCSGETLYVCERCSEGFYYCEKCGYDYLKYHETCPNCSKEDNND